MSKRALILGGNGVLGRAMVNSFKQRSWKVLSIDFKENAEADSNLVLDMHEPVQNQIQSIYKNTESFSKEYNSIVCTAGGFQVSHISDNDILEKFHEIDKSCFQSALLTGHLSTKYLAPQGLLVFTGAAAVFEGPVNFAYGYAMSKAATHALALQMAERTEIPESSTVCCILPQVIDTPGNREAMPDVDTSEWQPPEKIAQLVRSWADGDNRPTNGAFAKLAYESGSIVPEFV